MGQRDLAHDVEAEPQSAPARRLGWGSTPERLEQLAQHGGRNGLALVGDFEDGVAPLDTGPERDHTLGAAVVERVRQEVRYDLLQPDRVPVPLEGTLVVLKDRPTN
jgi:hypothetical protein